MFASKVRPSSTRRRFLLTRLTADECAQRLDARTAQPLRRPFEFLRPKPLPDAAVPVEGTVTPRSFSIERISVHQQPVVWATGELIPVTAGTCVVVDLWEKRDRLGQACSVIFLLLFLLPMLAVVLTMSVTSNRTQAVMGVLAVVGVLLGMFAAQAYWGRFLERYESRFLMEFLHVTLEAEERTGYGAQDRC